MSKSALFVRTLFLSALVVLVLAACQSGSGDEPATAAPGASPTAVEAAATRVEPGADTDPVASATPPPLVSTPVVTSAPQDEPASAVEPTASIP
ncbi:MAG: hypothetical protein ACOC9C_01680, partial [Chloroflexota bacterium]